MWFILRQRECTKLYRTNNCFLWLLSHCHSTFFPFFLFLKNDSKVVEHWLENSCKCQEDPENTLEKDSEETPPVTDACPALGSRNNQWCVQLPSKLFSASWCTQMYITFLSSVLGLRIEDEFPDWDVKETAVIDQQLNFAVVPYMQILLALRHPSNWVHRSQVHFVVAMLAWFILNIK